MGSVRTTASSTIATTLAVLPVGLLGALAVLVRAELGFSEARLGLTFTLYFLAAAVASAPGGSFADRVGAPRAIRLWSVVIGVSLIGIAALAVNWVVLVGFLLVAGFANGAVQPATNRALSNRAIRFEALAFGIKQSAVPLAYSLAGLSVPMIALQFGWRWAMGSASLLVLFILALEPRRPADVDGASRDRGTRSRTASPTGRPVPMTGLLILAAAIGLGTAAAISTNAFFVESAVARGFDPGLGGLMLAVGSGTAIVTRMGIGWLVDLRPEVPSHRYFTLVAVMLAAGAAGYVLLSLAATPALIVVGGVLAFGFGWGWTGLLIFAVATIDRSSAARATGIVQTGVFIGGVFGPSAFGLLVTHVSFGAAWLMNAVTALLAVVAIGFGRKVLLDTEEAPETR